MRNMKNVKKMILGFIVISMVGLAGCAQKTPLQKLQSDERYDDMTPAFWAHQQENKTPLWADAVDYCKNNSGKPNCASVMQVYVISNGSIKVSAYGTSGNTLSAPNF